MCLRISIIIRANTKKTEALGQKHEPPDWPPPFWVDHFFVDRLCAGVGRSSQARGCATLEAPSKPKDFSLRTTCKVLVK